MYPYREVNVAIMKTGFQEYLNKSGFPNSSIGWLIFRMSIFCIYPEVGEKSGDFSALE